MKNDLTPAHLERLAQRRAGAKLGWYIHATVYAVVNSGLVALSLANGRHWAVFPLLGWGIGLALHGAAVWLAAPAGRWRERQVQQEREKLNSTVEQRDPW